MAKKKYDIVVRGKPSPVVQKTVDMTTAAVGLGVASGIGATIPGLPGTIVTAGAMPIAAVSMLPMAAEDPRTYGQKRRRRRR